MTLLDKSLQLTDVQKAFDTGNQSSKAAFQASVSGEVVLRGNPTAAEFQTALNAAAGGVLRLMPGETYTVDATLRVPPGRTIIIGNNAKIVADFAGNYSTPLFAYPAADASVHLMASDIRIEGNCVAFDLVPSIDGTPNGLRVILERIYFNTMDGNRRQGTRFIRIDQADFVSISDVDIWNADTAFVIGSAPPRRNCTQIELSMLAVGQTNALGYIRGVDKGRISSVDISRCNSGLYFAGNNQRIECTHVHVEGIARSGYGTASGDITAAAAGVGYYFEDSQQNLDIKMSQCSVIDMSSTGGAAVAGVYIGRCDNNAIQNIEWDGCRIAATSEGSASYKPIINRGRLNWRGGWPFTSDASMHANARAYQDTIIRDDVGMWPAGGNLLNSDTVLGLTNSNSVTTPPVITEVAGGTNRIAGHDVAFASAYELTQNVNVPYGWVTLDVTGFRSAGTPVLLVQNNSTFADAVRVQFNSPGDRSRRWRLSFFNPVPGQGHRVGIVGSSASDVVHVSSITLYRGFATAAAPIHDGAHVLAALPAASTYWLGKSVIVRVAGVADAEYRCVRNASGSPTWEPR